MVVLILVEKQAWRERYLRSPTKAWSPPEITLHEYQNFLQNKQPILGSGEAQPQTLKVMVSELLRTAQQLHGFLLKRNSNV